MAELVKAIPTFLMHIFVPTLGVCLAAWLGVLCITFLRKQVRPVFSFSGCDRRVLPVEWVAIAAVMAVCTLFSGKGTSGVNNVGGMSLKQFNPPFVQIVTPQDVSNGWRVAEETEAEAFAPPPASAVTNEQWRFRGAHDDAFRIPTNGWSYPYASGVTVLSRGEIRKDIRTTYFPRAFAQDLSLFPVVNWPLLPEGRRESFFWRAATPSNTLLMTWCNAALGRNATNTVNFQAELFPDGGFTYRYEDRSVRHVRVWPFDWDDDGLENSVDPDPLTAGPDAHGTNAEWYNTVCSNVVETIGCGTGTMGILPVNDVNSLPWRESVNSNAYYFVDVVTELGPAPIYFTGDRESRLGNPVVVALAGVTNRVPLLIGIDYAITSPVPFSASFPVDYTHPTITTNSVANYNVHWPLNFVFTESIGESNRVYAVTVEPYDPGGVLEWDNAVPMRGVSSGGNCDCVLCSGYFASFMCSSTCTCSGDCKARGMYRYEMAELAFEGGECRCGFDDPPWEDTSSSHEPGDPPYLTITFSDSAVIFEDAYEDSPGVTKPRRSTRVRLTIDAYGGTYGGILSLSATNLGKLTPIGEGVTLPFSLALASEESFHSTCVYEGDVESGSEGDVAVDGIFSVYFTAQQFSTRDSLTVVRVALRPQKLAPENPCVNRHVYGVDESVDCLQQPSSPQVHWEPVADGSVSNSLPICYICPTHAQQGGFSARIGTALLPLQINVIEPSEVVCSAYGFLPEDILTGIGMALELKLKPFNVSFEGLKFQEVAAPPTATSPAWGIHNGYFNDISYQMRWYHYVTWGAGTWRTVVSGNQIGGYDQSRMFTWPQPWSTGRMTWVIPMAWKSKHSVTDSPDGQLATHYISEWVMSSDHIIKTKHQQELTLTESGLVFLNGERYDPR